MISIFQFFSLSVFSSLSAVVFVPTDPAPEEVRAAEELAYYWEKLTGEEVVVKSERWPEGPRLRHHRFGAWRPFSSDSWNGLSFFVGETRAAGWHAPLPEGLDPDGFALKSDGARFFLRGGSPAGSRFAVARFLDEYAGVRWYFPTELGEHLSGGGLESLPVVDRVEEPAFKSRQWSAATRFTESDWEIRNLMGRRYRFHHNLHRVFTEEVFESRPDFFIKLRGERIRPDDAQRGLNYQPCFGNPEAARFAARKAAEFFDANPGEMSFAFGMTDTHHICECPDCQQWIDPKKEFRGRPDYSDLVFTFMNRAAEELGRTHPDKFLGTLAYHWAENVPSFPVHPKVIPYLTADRSMWFHEPFREEDRDLMSRWAAAGPERLGIYDYYYGTSFIIPRLFTAITAETLHHAHQAGIDGFYAEIGSNWSLDGPKAWLTSQLLWDPSQDREELLARFYEGAFGAAAEPMASFFTLCEDIWMNQRDPVFWLKFYFDFTQLELFPPAVCVKLRALLDEARALAPDGRNGDRVALVAEGFRVTELYSDLYHGLREAAARSDAFDLDETIEVLEKALKQRERLEAYYQDVLLPNPLHRPRARMEAKARFLPGMKVARLVERAAALARESEREKELAELVGRLSTVFPESRAEVVFGTRDASSIEVLMNGSFEEDALESEGGEELMELARITPFFWTLQGQEAFPVGTYGQSEALRGATGFVLTEEKARDGRFSVRVENTVYESLYQRVPVSPGRVYRFSAWAIGKVSPGSRVEIELTWGDADGARIEEDFLHLDQLLPGRVDDWQELVVFATAPAAATRGHARLTVRDQGSGDVVYFDEVTVRRF